MRLSRLKLESYKKIENCEVTLSQPITAFVGRNNSGKSSILSAIFTSIQSAGEQGTQINRSIRDGFARVELGFFLSRNEWAQLSRISGSPHPPLSIDQCEMFEPFELTKRREWRYTEGRVVDAPQFLLSPELQSLRTSESQKVIDSLNRLANSNLREVFGAAQIITAGRKLGATLQFVPYNTLRQGNPLDQFNSWLYHLKRKDPNKYQEFVYEVKSVFPDIDILDVDYDQDTGNVDIKVTEQGVVSPGVDMGSGWHSMLALYSYMLSPGFSVLLLDEPDAHMHASLVRLLTKFLIHISSNVQIVIATHNPVFINSLPISALWYFVSSEGGKSTVRRTESSTDLQSLLQGLGLDIPNEVVPIIAEFERTRAAQTLLDGVDPRLDLKNQILEGSKDWMFSYYPHSDISALQRDLAPGCKGFDLANELNKCPKGKNSAELYQKICAEILGYTLSPPLLEPMLQSSTEGGLQRRDIVIHIPHGLGGFWRWIMDNHAAIAVIAECKNYSEMITQGEVTLTSKYFGEGRLGKFGLLITRIGLDSGAQEEVKRLWREDKKMLVPLSDQDILVMLRLKEYGGRPESAIDMHIRKLREGLQ